MKHSASFHLNRRLAVAATAAAGEPPPPPPLLCVYNYFRHYGSDESAITGPSLYTFKEIIRVIASKFPPRRRRDIYTPESVARAQLSCKNDAEKLRAREFENSRGRERGNTRTRAAESSSYIFIRHDEESKSLPAIADTSLMQKFEKVVRG